MSVERVKNIIKTAQVMSPLANTMKRDKNYGIDKALLDIQNELEE